MKVSEFIFQKGKIVSIYGESGSGKTSILLQVVNDTSPSLYISTEGVSYQGRVEKLRWKKDVNFVEVSNIYELVSAILYSSKLSFKVIAIDTINNIYRQSRKDKDLEYPLLLLYAMSQENNVKIILSWQVSVNSRVTGEKFMRRFSEDVYRVTKNHVIIGNLRVCRFKINKYGVEGCL